MNQDKKEKKISFKDTLNLPHTDFPIRAQAKEDDPKIISRWEQEKLFKASFEHNKGKEKFILHDGPPYANGNIHIGHAYNKVLKDITTKSQRMMGKHAPVQPGWDCHGMPIEQQVTKENPGIAGAELKKAARAYARKWIDIQRKSFKDLGVLMDWDRPYITMDPGYESSILRAFGKFVAEGYIERKNKTVPWCSTCQTVLATAEIEYQDRKDPSIYVAFPLSAEAVAQLAPELQGKEVSLLVWTTTPWTLPLNRAVLMRPDTPYVVLELNDSFVVVAKDLADAVASAAKAKKKVIVEFNSDLIAKLKPKVQHPFIDALQVPVLLDNSVLIGEGTACVHSAPGCGPEDYEVGIKNNLEIFSPLSPDGKYIFGIEPKELEGLDVKEVLGKILTMLTDRGRLIAKTSITHSYPHCWRCRQGLIFRATKQWFCDLEKGDLKNRVLKEIEHIQTLPKSTKKRLTSTVEGRLEWCLSRQRTWGVPIPALLCDQCDYTYITKEMIEKVAHEVSKVGVEYWDAAKVEDFLPKDFVCPTCTSATFKKETDILDVWFDSGISHFAVLNGNPELGFPSDMYLEGKDQHRGWFQSSLLTAMVLEGKAPMKTIVTHGFTVDEQGRKMSKSLGNVVSPTEMIDKLGTDGLRLWVSSVDISGDAVVSDTLTRNVQEVFRKIRNTCRFLLANLYDFDIDKDAVPFEKLRLIDQYALEQLCEMNMNALSGYAEFDFTAVFHLLANCCTVNLSSFYLDIIKDRLYVEKADGHARRSAQTACWYILDTMTRLIAPILSITAEQLSDNYQKNKKQSIHLQEFAQHESLWQWMSEEKIKKIINPNIESYAKVYFGQAMLAQEKVERMMFVAEQYEQWNLLNSIRSALLKAIEGLRETGELKHSLEARLTIHFDAALKEKLTRFFQQLQQSGQSLEDFFKEFVIVSQVALADKAEGLRESDLLKGLYVSVEHAQGDKCPRCWNWEQSEHEHKLCKRCQEIVK